MNAAARWAWRVAGLLLVLGVVTSAVAWQQGYRLYIVHTGSMEPTLRSGDAVLDGPVPSTVGPGQVITFRAGSGPESVVTHRVSAVSEGLVHTRGDANRSDDAWALPRSHLLGATVARLPRAGYVLYFLRQPVGLASVVTSVAALVLLWGLFFPPEAARTEPEAQQESQQEADPGAGEKAGPEAGVEGRPTSVLVQLREAGRRLPALEPVAAAPLVELARWFEPEPDGGPPHLAGPRHTVRTVEDRRAAATLRTTAASGDRRTA